MNSKEIKEIKQRFTHDGCTITKMHGVYVDKNKDIVTRIDERFLNLPDDEFYKYLDIVKEIYQPKQVDNKNITLDIRKNSVIKDLLGDVVHSELKDISISENDLYNEIIQHYSCLNGYLILLFYDAYDVPKVTLDNIKLDDSEEVYQYITCAICPVILTDAALGYDKSVNEFKPIERNWIVGKPKEGFVWPAFNDRSADKDAILYYTSQPKEPDHEIMENVLECEKVYTAAEGKDIFENIFSSVIDNKTDCERILSDVNAALYSYEPRVIDKKKACDEKLDDDSFKAVLQISQVAEGYIDSIVKEYSNAFKETGWPKTAWIYNDKYRAMHYAVERKNRARHLLTQASNALNHNGGSELADEIDAYLDRMR